MSDSLGELRRSGDIAAVNRLMPYAGAVGLEVMEDDAGLITVLRFRPTNIGNPFIPAIHGGVVGALLEHAAILHLMAEQDDGAMPKIINISIDYLRPCLTEDAFARCTTVRAGRRVANVRAEAWQADPAKPVAAAHAHFLIK